MLLGAPSRLAPMAPGGELVFAGSRALVASAQHAFCDAGYGHLVIPVIVASSVGTLVIAHWLIKLLVGLIGLFSRGLITVNINVNPALGPTSGAGAAPPPAPPPGVPPPPAFPGQPQQVPESMFGCPNIVNSHVYHTRLDCGRMKVARKKFRIRPCDECG